MATYTVQKGDTLSGIASKLGLSSYKDLTGYRSGNPNLIYAGENLSYGGAAPAAAPAPAAPAAPAGPTELQSFADKMASEQSRLLAEQKAEQEGYFNQYAGAIQGQEKLPDMYGRLRNELGIPELSQTFQSIQGEIFNVKNLLDQLGDNVTSRGQGTFMTEAQRQRQISAEGDPLRTALGRLGTGLEPVAQALTGAQGELSTLLSLNAQQQSKELSPLEMRIDALGDRYAREITGFTASKQTQLDALMDKIDRERQLSDREWELAQQLAAEERAFSRSKELAKIQAASSASSSSYLPSYNKPASSSSTTKTAVPNIMNFMPTSGGNSLQISSGNPLTLQGSGGIKLQSGNNSGISLQGGTGYTLQGGGVPLSGSLRW